MAKRAQAYPQVDPGGAGLVNVGITAVGTEARVGEAIAAARARNAGVVTAGEAFVLRDDLVRAAGLGLADLPVVALARPLPVVESRATEVSVRRLLAAGAPFVMVRDHRRLIGAAMLPALRSRLTPLGARFEHRLPEADRSVLGLARRLAAARGVRAFLAGGVVRDAFRKRAGTDRQQRDLDIVVEGDGIGFARALGAAVGAARDVTEHARFLTASIAGPGGGRIDVATARSERYETRGALPRVLPATVGQDLARRDFTVNALAIELESGDFGLLDPFGGRLDVERRRLRALQPLSFVEDPTRIFRAARYAVRLELTLDAWTAGAVALALRLVPYPALSGPRLLAELELVLTDHRPERTLRRLGLLGAFRLLDGRHRFGRRAAARVGALVATLGWAHERGLRVSGAEMAALVLLADQPPEVAAAALVRLGFSGEPLRRLGRALETGAALVTELPTARVPSARARALTERSDVELAWLWLLGGPAARSTLDWYLEHARGLRPALRGDELVELGVPRGAEVARALSALRAARLDGQIDDRTGEVVFVRDWLTGQARKEG